jgi:hypothetical protein
MGKITRINNLNLNKMKDEILSTKDFLLKKMFPNQNKEDLDLYYHCDDRLRNVIIPAINELITIHVQLALEAAAENVTTKERKKIHKCSSGIEYSYTTVIDKKSIINSYPIDNIK